MTQGFIDWIDLAPRGYELVVAEFAEPAGAQAVAIRGDRPVSPSQAEALRRNGYSRIPGPREVWARDGGTFTLAEIEAAFPGVAPSRIPASKAKIGVRSRSPFAPKPPEPASPGPASAARMRPASPPPRPAATPAIEVSEPQSAQSVQQPAQENRRPGPAPLRPAPSAVRQPTAPDAPPVALSAAAPAVAVRAANKYQAVYEPKSRVGKPIAMIPLNLASPTRIALDRVEAEHGDIDAWVAASLGWSVEQMAQYLSPEQVDAVALALMAADRQRGLILADATGLGKGRILAALARAAVLSGRTVVFLTEKANLFSDFWRDIRDIGSDDIMGIPFMLNDDARIIDTNALNGRVLFQSPAPKDIQKAIKSGRMPGGTKIVMATYSQFNRKGTAKATFLKLVAEGARFIADEAHNAVGDSNTSEAIALALDASETVTFSSATFARGARNMAAYRKVFPSAMRGFDIAEILAAGGRELQEVLSQALAEDGVLVRREHDLSNLRIEVVEDAVRMGRNATYADALSPILAGLARLSLKVNDIAEQRNEENKDYVDSLPKGQRKAARARYTSANFGVRLAAIMRQFQTALLVDFCVERCVEFLRQGQKPVVVIENTMESLMRELSADDADLIYGADAGDGDIVQGELFGADAEELPEGVQRQPPTFRDALNLLLDRVVSLSVRRGDDDPVKEVVEDDEIQAKAKEIRRLVEDFPDLSLSPIDDIRDRVQEIGRSLVQSGEAQNPWAGDEISARGMRVTEGRYVPMPPRDRNQVISAFQNGLLDFLIITKAGSTGLSLHASERVKDQRVRVMLELQIASNVVERIQFWGRINRRGQVVEPFFNTLSTGLPFQVRTLAMQNKKVSDLSANVTGSSETAASMNVPDLIDSVGNEVARRLLEERPALAERMGIPMSVNRETADEELFYVNKILSRLPLLLSDQQEEAYQALVASYEDEMRALAAKGRHPHRTRELEGEWAVVSEELYEAGDPRLGEVFGRDVSIATIETVRETNPFSSADVRAAVTACTERLTQEFGVPGRVGFFFSHQRVIKESTDRVLAASLGKKHASVSAALKSPEQNAVKLARKRLDDMIQVLKTIHPGGQISMPNDDGEIATAIIMDIRPPPHEEAHLPGQYSIRYAFPGDERTREMSLAGIIRDERIVTYPFRDAPGALAFPQFDRVPRGTVKVKRKVWRNNAFAAVREAKAAGFGSMVIWHDPDGIRHRGVLVPRSKQNALHMVPAKTNDPAVAVEVMRRGCQTIVTSPEKPGDGAIVRFENGIAIVEVPSPKRGAKAFETEALLKAVGGRFMDSAYKGREARVQPVHLPYVFKALVDAGHLLYFDGKYRSFVSGLVAGRQTGSDIQTPAPAPQVRGPLI
jgi:hypothetical protein